MWTHNADFISSDFGLELWIVNTNDMDKHLTIQIWGAQI